MIIKWLYKIIDFLFNSKIFLWALWIFAIVYIFVFYDLFTTYHYKAIGIHTNIFIYLLCYLSIYTLKKLKVIPITIFNNIKYYISILFVIEIFLIIVQPEKIIIPYSYYQYAGIYSTNNNNHFHTSSPHSEYLFSSKGEFEYKRTSNHLGFSDKDWDLDKKDEELRVFCLGDSFTEGDGANKDSTYVSFLQRALKKKHPNVELFNAGKRGSDPFYNFESLKKILSDYQPDIIIQTFNSDDFFHDFVIFGGKERFVNDTALQFRKNYWWEPIYASSYIARIFIQSIGGYDKYLIKAEEYPKIYEDLENQTLNLFKEYKQFTDDRNIDLILCNFPFKNGKTESYIDFHNKFNQKFETIQLKYYDLSDCYLKYGALQKKSLQDYYWKIDGHHNAQGYEMMAHCIEEILIPILDKRQRNKNTLLN